MQYNKMCLICYVNAYHYKLNVNADKCNKKSSSFTNVRTYRQFNTSTSTEYPCCWYSRSLNYR